MRTLEVTDSELGEIRRNRRKLIDILDNQTDLITSAFGDVDFVQGHSILSGTAKYESRNLRIEKRFGRVGERDCDFYGVKIFYKGDLVYEEGGRELYSYVKGEWEGLLTRLSTLAKRTNNKR